jgi:hypothetical protein
MTRLHRRLLAKPNRAHTLAFASLLIAATFAVLTVVLYYNATAQLSRQEAAQAKGQAAVNKAELHRLQAAFCGTSEVPGLLPVIASAPITPQTTQLGRSLIDGSKRAIAAIECPTPARRTP